jgi:hypothetical protein
MTQKSSLEVRGHFLPSLRKITGHYGPKFTCLVRDVREKWSILKKKLDRIVELAKSVILDIGCWGVREQGVELQSINLTFALLPS